MSQRGRIDILSYMDRRRNRTRVAAITAIALLAGVVLPASPASAAHTDIDLDTRCVLDYGAVYPASSGLAVPNGSAGIDLTYPSGLSDYLEGGLDAVNRSVSISGPGGMFVLEPTASSINGLSVDLPAEVFAGAIVGTSTVELVFWGWVDRYPYCPVAADFGGVPTDISFSVTATITSASTDRALFDLDSTPAGSTDPNYVDYPSSARAPVDWGDTVTLHAEPGFFTGEALGVPQPVTLTAQLGVVWPFFGGTPLPAPFVSADGSTATVTLPDENPAVAIDPENWWLYGEAEIRIYGMGSNVIAGISTPEPAPVVITGTTPKLKSIPKVLRTVKADAGAWGPVGVTLSYQWLLNGKPVKGATASKYTPKIKDVGKKLAVQVTGTFEGADPVTLTSAAHRIRLL